MTTLITTGRVQDKASWKKLGWTAIDVTVKSAGNAKPLAPTWNMVMGYKRGSVSEAEYTQQYRQILAKSQKQFADKWERTLRNHKKIVFLCYCAPKEFCHRYLLAKEFIRYAVSKLKMNDVTLLPEKNPHSL